MQRAHARPIIARLAAWLLVPLVAALGVPLVSAAPASAETANVQGTCDPVTGIATLSVDLSGYDVGSEPNAILVELDGVFVTDTEFGADYHGEWDTPIMGSAVDWHVTVAAVNIPQGFTDIGTITACQLDRVVPMDPTVTQPSCTGPGEHSDLSVRLPDGPDGVTYSWDKASHLVTAKADSTHAFNLSLPAGWTRVDDRTATYQVEEHDPGACLVTVTPTKPTVTTSTGCGIDDTLHVAEDTAKVTYKKSPDGATVTATAATGYQFPGGKAKQTWVNGTDYTSDTVANGGIEPCPPLVVHTDPTLEPAQVGVPYTVKLDATGGDGDPLTWSLTPDAQLPPGLTLSKDGVISGTPTQAGDFAFDIVVGDPVTTSFTLTVQPAAAPPAQAPARPAPTTATPAVLPNTGSPVSLGLLTLAGTLLLGGWLLTTRSRTR